MLQRGETHARRGVAARAENQAGVKPQRNAPVVRRFEPFRHNDELFADLDRLVILPPVVLPVAVLHVSGGNLPADTGADRLQQRTPFVVVGEIEFYARYTSELAFQLVIDVVPILVVIGQKRLKIRLVLHDHAARAQRRELLANRVDLLALGRHGGFDPFHMRLLLCA